MTSELKSVFTFSRYINGVLMAEGVTITRSQTIEEAAKSAARIAARGSNGETPVLVYIPDTRAAPDVPELVRYQPIAVTWDDGSPKTTEMVAIKDGEYVRHDQAVEVIAAKDAEITQWRDIASGYANKFAAAKLAQIDDQKPVGVISKVKMSSLAGLVCNIFNPLDGDFEVPDGLKLYAAPVASEAETIERLREAFKQGWQYSNTAHVEDGWEDTFAYLYTDESELRALTGKEPS